MIASASTPTAPTNAVNTRSSGTITRSTPRKAPTSRPWRAIWASSCWGACRKPCLPKPWRAPRAGGGRPGLRLGPQRGWFWRRQQRRLGHTVEATSAALTSFRAAPAPKSRPGTELSPLGAAIQDNDLQKASELLASGADPNAISRFETPLEQALTRKNREIIRLLIEFGADLRALDGRTPLQKAFERDPELAAWLFRQLPDPTVLDAAEAGTLDDLRKLVDAGGDVNMVSQDRRRFSPLQAAALRGDVEIARFLLERGADLNYRARGKARRGDCRDLGVFGRDDRAAPEPRGGSERDGPRRPHSPVRSRYIILVRRAGDIDSSGCRRELSRADGSTPLHHAAARNSDTDARAIHTLVQHGAKLDAQDNQGFTPLHAALERTMADAARTLLDLVPIRRSAIMRTERPSS